MENECCQKQHDECNLDFISRLDVKNLIATFKNNLKNFKKLVKELFSLKQWNEFDKYFEQLNNFNQIWSKDLNTIGSTLDLNEKIKDGDFDQLIATSKLIDEKMTALIHENEFIQNFNEIKNYYESILLIGLGFLTTDADIETGPLSLVFETLRQLDFEYRSWTMLFYAKSLPIANWHLNMFDKVFDVINKLGVEVTSNLTKKSMLKQKLNLTSDTQTWKQTLFLNNYLKNNLVEENNFKTLEFTGVDQVEINKTEYISLEVYNSSLFQYLKSLQSEVSNSYFGSGLMRDSYKKPNLHPDEYNIWITVMSMLNLYIISNFIDLKKF
ncbi:hypothetical protein SCLARK_001318 [Spiroplasma clarkii]|nr:hypothetical protein SCLARK_001318 [Spiroplasma clarkii]